MTGAICTILGALPGGSETAYPCRNAISVRSQADLAPCRLRQHESGSRSKPGAAGAGSGYLLSSTHTPSQSSGGGVCL